MQTAWADRKLAQCLLQGADLFRSMLQDLGHFGAHRGHGSLLQLPELACVGASICILGVVADIPAPVQTVLLNIYFHKLSDARPFVQTDVISSLHHAATDYCVHCCYTYNSMGVQLHCTRQSACISVNRHVGMQLSHACDSMPVMLVTSVCEVHIRG